MNGLLVPEKAEFEDAIDAPDLKSLWPGLGGSLKGDGHVQGKRKTPEVTFQAKGKALHLSAYSAERLSLTMDYHADTPKSPRYNCLPVGSIPERVKSQICS